MTTRLGIIMKNRTSQATTAVPRDTRSTDMPTAAREASFLRRFLAHQLDRPLVSDFATVTDWLASDMAGHFP